MSIVNRKAIDWLRKKKRTSENLKDYYESRTGISENSDQNLGELQKLRKAIRLLPEGQQIVLKLFYTESYSILEICEILGTVKSRLFYAREKLKIFLNNRNHD